MTDEAFVFNQTVRERKATGYGAYHKKRKGGRTIRFPSDNLSRRERQQMNGEVPAVKDEASVRVCHVAVFLGQVAILDHAGLVVLEGENAHAFLRVRLVNDLRCAGRHPVVGESPDECGVADAAERVVDAVEEHVLHALFYEPCERTALGECAEAAAVAVGYEREPVAVEYGLAVGSERADGALLEEADVVAVHPEEVVFGKEVDGCLVVQRARHDAPGNRVADLCGKVLQAFCLELEEALVAREPDVEHALRTVEAEARTLAARDEERRNLALPEQHLADFLPVVVLEVVLGNAERHRLQVGGNVVRLACCRFFDVERLQFFPVLACDVSFEELAGFAGEFYKVRRQFLLAGRVQSLDNIHAP